MERAANGPSSPNSANRTANTDDSWSVVQPNSRLKGCSVAPGRPRAAEVVGIARKVTAATTQPQWMPRRPRAVEVSRAIMAA